MIVQVEASLYPLGTPAIGETIDMFLQRLSRPGLDIAKSSMSTRIEGDLREVFPALSEAFERVASDAAVVLAVKVSNACPVPKKNESGHSPHHTARKESNTHGS